MRMRRRLPPVLLVHGFDGHGAKDAAELAALAARLGPRARTVGYYAGDTAFDLVLPGVPATTDTGLDELAWRLMEHVLRAGVTVDLVGHSMGGLIVGRAVRLLPGALVRRVVLLGTPFAGLPSAVGTAVAQCRDMSPGSAWLAAADVSAWRADLVVASACDEAVPVASATVLPGAVVLGAGERLHHGDLVTRPEVLDRVAAALR